MRDHPRTVLLLAIVLLLPTMSGCIQTLENPSTLVVGQTWPTEITGIQTAWRQDGLDGSGVTVAIVDSGIAIDHPEFQGLHLKGWKDLVNGRSTPYDDNGHGTNVAGILAAQGRWETLAQGFRLRGGAPGVNLLVVKAIDARGNGSESNVASGIDWATQHGADIIVLSLGDQSTRLGLGSQTQNAVNRAIDKGVFVVAAAGNAPHGSSSCNSVASPANVADVIAVGAVDQNKVIAPFSCHGSGNEPNALGMGGRSDPNKKPEVVAPGDKILSTWNGGTCGTASKQLYCQASGTSQAVPFVASALALLLQEHPELQRQSRSTVEQVKQRIMVTAEKIGPLAGKGATAHDDAYGYGLIRADKLIAAYS